MVCPHRGQGGGYELMERTTSEAGTVFTAVLDSMSMGISASKGSLRSLFLSQLFSWSSASSPMTEFVLLTRSRICCTVSLGSSGSVVIIIMTTSSSSGDAVERGASLMDDGMVCDMSTPWVAISMVD